MMKEHPKWLRKVMKHDEHWDNEGIGLSIKSVDGDDENDVVQLMVD